MTTLDGTAVSQVANLAELAAGVDVVADIPVPDGRDVCFISRPDGVNLEPLDLERFRDYPYRKTGTARFYDPDSFGRYVTAHGGPETAVHVDLDAEPAGTRADGVTVAWAVLNDHEPGASGQPGHRDHRAELHLRFTPDWLRWRTTISDDDAGRAFTQVKFADFLEAQEKANGRALIEEPTHSDFVALVDTLHATARIGVKETAGLDNGGTSVSYEKEVKIRAGKTGDVTFPATLRAVSQVFRGFAPDDAWVRFTARLRVVANPEQGVGVVIKVRVPLLDDIQRQQAEEAVNHALAACGHLEFDAPAGEDDPPAVKPTEDGVGSVYYGPRPY